MTSRVMLISPAVGPSLRQARFDDDGPLDPAGAEQAKAVAAAAAVPAADRVLASPSVRCRETAAALGLNAAPAPPGPGGWAMGRWRGRTLAEVMAAEPEAVAAWLADPASAPHGGESLLDLCERVGGWLDAAADEPGRLIAVVESDVVRAAVVRALGIPAAAFWRIDVGPLAAVELSGRAGRWNLRAGRPLGFH